MKQQRIRESERLTTQRACRTQPLHLTPSHPPPPHEVSAASVGTRHAPAHASRSRPLARLTQHERLALGPPQRSFPQSDGGWPLLHEREQAPRAGSPSRPRPRCSHAPGTSRTARAACPTRQRTRPAPAQRPCSGDPSTAAGTSPHSARATPRNLHDLDSTQRSRPTRCEMHAGHLRPIRTPAPRTAPAPLTALYGVLTLGNV